MNTFRTVLVSLTAAVACVGAAGCSGAQPESNAETCARIQSVGSGPTSNSEKAGMIRLANRLRPI